MTTTATPILTDELRSRIEGYFPRYPTKQAVVLPALHAVNESLRCVPPEAIPEIAELLELSPAEVHDTMSFYGFFSPTPLGRHRCWVCRSISCALRGGEEMLDYAGRKLGIRPGQTTPDGRITLEFAECLGACEFAPVMLAGTTLCKDLTPEKIDDIVAGLR